MPQGSKAEAGMQVLLLMTLLTFNIAFFTMPTLSRPD
jgi:hypothetical protein